MARSAPGRDLRRSVRDAESYGTMQRDDGDMVRRRFDGAVALSRVERSGMILTGQASGLAACPDAVVPV
ncbi:MAG: hypothetical protein H0W06_09175 [Chloroflexia bacterium]|nr:hypothetical protein [Chloroflexia bacterium]